MTKKWWEEYLCGAWVMTWVGFIFWIHPQTSAAQVTGIGVACFIVGLVGLRYFRKDK